ncbi:MAG: PPOX class F420-dependent oxidoreductase [Caldilineae bacterium]|nr:MAG: PPOX class F420-dependent oxidoreductase [Caldilineae bacterium]
MTMDIFDGHQYLNIETFRKNGAGVKTPVWFVREGDALYVWTQTDSGKARRIRRNGRVRIAPCKADGTPLGEWLDAHAKADDSPAALAHVKRLMAKKYGLAFRGFQMMGKLRKARHTRLKITLPEVHL